MANNGYLVSGVCTGDIFAKFSSQCPSGTYAFYTGVTLPSAIGRGTCYSRDPSSGALSVLKSIDVPNFECEISGPPLSEIQQIEAINAMFPAAVAILATAWAFKWLRNMVYEWLKERNQND